MSKVNIDSTNLKITCMLSINDSIKGVNKVIKYFDNFTIPSDFYKRSELLQVEDELNDILRDLTAIKNWIVDSNTDYNKLLTNLRDQAEKLPNYNLKRRNNIV